MNSRLYECQIMHARFSPAAHRFVYRLFMLAIDLDELDTISRRLHLLSVNRSNLYGFREQDHLPTHEGLHHPSGPVPTEPARAPGRLKERVLAHLAHHGIELPGGRIELITLPRILGYHFNPVSFFFCTNREGEAVAVITEVTNTFREMKPFLLGPQTRTAGPGGGFHLRVPKHFYVSPFSDVDVAFDFTLRNPGENLNVQIDDYVGETRTLTSVLTGRSRPLTDAALAWFTFKYPLLTLRVIGLIHWHAFLLYLKKIPWYRKAARATDQRDLHRPHASIVPAKLPDSA